MEENKNLNPELETEEIVTEITEETAEKPVEEQISENTEETVGNETDEDSEELVDEIIKAGKKSKFSLPKSNKPKKPKKLKNQAAFKKGGYSLAITSAVIVGVIIINILFSALSTRFVLEFDMSKNKDNSMDKNNIKYVQGIESDVDITVCAGEEDYSSYMGYYAQEYGVSDNAAVDYYDQTVTLLKKYSDYNKNITINFVNPQSTAFTDITSKYMNETLAYGDIIVSAGEGTNAKHKIVGYKDIYSLYEDSTYASYGMTYYTVTGNNLETAVTSAISYVLTDEIKKVALLTGHSSVDYTSTYKTMLQENNYDVTVVEDKLITSISKDFDAIAIVCPSIDFSASELDAISEFLDNDSKLGKGLMLYADASAPYLKELYDFVSQWGIVVEEGIVYETNEQNHLENDPTTIGTYSTERDDMLDGIGTCISGNNVPLYPAFENKNSITVTPLTATSEQAVVAPKGTSAGWAGADKKEKREYNGCVIASKSDYDEDNNPIASRVAVFSSTHFIESEYSEMGSVTNKELAMAVTESTTGADDNGIVFTSKYLESETFTVNETSAKTMRTIFMWIIPLLTIAVSIFVYIRRKNA